MGIFGNVGRSLQKAADNIITPDPTTFAGRLGQFGAYLGAASGSPLGQASLAMQQDRRKQQEDLLDRYYRQAQIAHLMQGPDEPAIVRTARSIGLDPSTPQGRDWITNAETQPRYFTLGSPETGQQIVQAGGAGGGAAGGIQPGTVEDGYVFLGGDAGNPANWRKQ